MDKLTRYGEIIKKILTEYYQIVEKAPDFHPENCLIFDDNN
ncbi:MAG: element excision factor XisI family protein, partial [Dolichospermum sp.]